MYNLIASILATVTGTETRKAAAIRHIERAARREEIAATRSRLVGGASTAWDDVGYRNGGAKAAL